MLSLELKCSACYLQHMSRCWEMLNRWAKTKKKTLCVLLRVFACIAQIHFSSTALIHWTGNQKSFSHWPHWFNIINHPPWSTQYKIYSRWLIALLCQFVRMEERITVSEGVREAGSVFRERERKDCEPDQTWHQHQSQMSGSLKPLDQGYLYCR